MKIRRSARLLLIIYYCRDYREKAWVMVPPPMTISP